MSKYSVQTSASPSPLTSEVPIPTLVSFIVNLWMQKYPTTSFSSRLNFKAYKVQKDKRTVAYLCGRSSSSSTSSSPLVAFCFASESLAFEIFSATTGQELGGNHCSGLNHRSIDMGKVICEPLYAYMFIYFPKGFGVKLQYQLTTLN